MTSESTRATLLLKIRDTSDSRSWMEFVHIYTPLLYAYALKAGLQDSDAADVAQETLSQVIRHIGRFEYQRDRGTFRGWLFTIARNGIRKHANRGKRMVRGSGDTDHQALLDQAPSPNGEDPWEMEYQRRLFEMAAERIREEFRPATWQAFWRTSVEGIEASRVSEELRMSLGAVYIARSRVLTRLREEVRRLDE